MYVKAYVRFLCANNKYLPLKMQINSIFIVNYLYIPNICCIFAADFMYIAEKGTGFVREKINKGEMDEIAVIQRKIYEIRGQKVILDRDLAALYQVETKVLNQAVKRNKERFPEDFMFQLTPKELKNWKSFYI